MYISINNVKFIMIRFEVDIWACSVLISKVHNINFVCI